MIAEALTGLLGIVVVLFAMYHVLNEVIHEKPLIAFVSLATFTFTLLLTFVGFITFQTVYHYELPMQVHAHYGIAVPHGSSTLFRYSRDFVVEKDFSADVYRRIDCVVGTRTHTFDLPHLSRDYKAGTYAKIDRYALYPVSLPVGAQCDMHTVITWTPSFSMSARSAELPLLLFQVAPKDIGALPQSEVLPPPPEEAE